METPTVLKKILTTKSEEVAIRQQAIPLIKLEEQCFGSLKNRELRSFSGALSKKIKEGAPAVIAEIKKASPSKGIIRKNFDPTEIALSYQAGGAACLSVLTESKYFLGSDDYLQNARNSTSLPVLRKDFIVEPYQIYESYVLGADCILLIVAALDQPALIDFHEMAIELGLDILVEVHNEEELERAMHIDNPMIGINNRNLHTFETDIFTTIKLLSKIPKNRIVITESGILTHKDVATMRGHQVNSFLIGETFMRADEPGLKLAEMFTKY